MLVACYGVGVSAVVVIGYDDFYKAVVKLHALNAFNPTAFIQLLTYKVLRKPFIYFCDVVVGVGCFVSLAFLYFGCYVDIHDMPLSILEAAML